MVSTGNLSQTACRRYENNHRSSGDMFLPLITQQTAGRPLSYVEDDIGLPTLAPSTFLFQRSQLPQEETWRIEEPDLRKRAKFLRNCKNSLWRRWQREYLTALRERHNLTHKATKFRPKAGDAVIVKTENKNRGDCRWR